MTLTVFIFRQFNSIRLLYRNKYTFFLFVGHLVAIAGAMMVVFDSGIGSIFIIGKQNLSISATLHTAYIKCLKVNYKTNKKLHLTDRKSSITL